MSPQDLEEIEGTIVYLHNRPKVLENTYTKATTVEDLGRFWETRTPKVKKELDLTQGLSAKDRKKDLKARRKKLCRKSKTNN